MYNIHINACMYEILVLKNTEIFTFYNNKQQEILFIM